LKALDSSLTSSTQCAVQRKPTTEPVSLSLDPISSPLHPTHTKHHVVDPTENQEDELFHGLFPKRQLYRPRVEYPLWDTNWDHRNPSFHEDDTTTVSRQRRNHERLVRNKGVTRHIILIRHGQYDEEHGEDLHRTLTALGIRQAHKTGERIAQLIHDLESSSSHRPVSSSSPQKAKVVALRVSNLTRAKETADIIAQHLPPSSWDRIVRSDPDEDLNEGRPCHHIPTSRVSNATVKKTDEGNARIERAFERYFYRADVPPCLGRLEHSTAGKEGQKQMQPYTRGQGTQGSTVVGNQESGAVASLDATEAASIVVATAPVRLEGGSEGGTKETTTRTSPVPIDRISTVHTDGTEQEGVVDDDDYHRHEYEIIVCHANVIRYFVCRALQIPQEAWLRFCIFNCSLTYLTIRPTGTVSCRMLGDIGHLDYEHTTFSMHHGFNW